MTKKYFLIGAMSMLSAYSAYYAITSSATPAPSEGVTIATAFGVGLLMLSLLTTGRRAFARIPFEKRPLVWISLAGWSLAGLILMALLSIVDLVAVALVPRPPDLRPSFSWIVTRAVSAGFILSLLPALLIVKFAGRSKQLVS